MAGPLSDEIFARTLNQMGIATLDQIEAATRVQKESSNTGASPSLADVLVQQGIITQPIRENVEKKAQVALQGGIKQLGAYKILKKIGEGGMGAVYLADDTAVGRKVALKILPKKYASDQTFLSRFRREAKATGKLNHVNIVTAYTTGEDMGVHYYAMEFCEGEPLDTKLQREKALTWDKAIEVTMQVARGLKHAHEHGLIHRDIKPANILLTKDGVAKILDLGLSKNIGDSEQSFATQTGVAMGTPHYISPEQARGDKGIDGRTDIYSLGATLYHLVTGQTPFQGSTAAMIMMQHLTAQLPNPQDIHDDIPDGIVLVIQKMMAKEPVDRYRNCDELLRDLELVIDGKMPSTHGLDEGKSSVAMRQKIAPPRRNALRGTHPVQQRKAAPNSVRAARPEDATQMLPAKKPAKNSALLIGGGVAAAALIAVCAFALGGKKNDNAPNIAERTQMAQTVLKQPDPPRHEIKPTVPAGTITADDAWVKEVQALPAEEQAKRINAEMKRLNDGMPDCKIDINNHRVISFECSADQTRTIAPVRALQDLERFVNHSVGRMTPLKDISPLKGMKLKRVELQGTSVSDLSPLRGMALEFLGLDRTPVSDLVPLSSMKIADLYLSETKIESIAALEGSSLRLLSVARTAVVDLSPLKNMKTLLWLDVSGTRVTNLEPLRKSAVATLILGGCKIADISPLADMTNLSGLVSDTVSKHDLDVLQAQKASIPVNAAPKAENPIAKTHVGDWLEYSIKIHAKGQNSDGILRQTVKSVTAKEIVVELVAAMNGKTEKKDVRIDMNDTTSLSPLQGLGVNLIPGMKQNEMQSGLDEITVGVKPFKTHWTLQNIETTDQGNKIFETVKTWTCPDVPIGGLVKTMVMGTLEMTIELRDFGHGAATPIENQNADGFVSLFNGRDLTGWEGDPAVWSVKDGAIVAKVNAGKQNNFWLVRRGMTVDDFEIRVLCRLETLLCNAAIGYRAKEYPDLEMDGYQLDHNVTDDHYGREENGHLYDGDRRRKLLAKTCTQVVAKNVNGQNQLQTVGDTGHTQDEVWNSLKKDGWNELTVVVQGNHIIHKINGLKVVDFTDMNEAQRSLSGLLSLKIWRYQNAVRAQFKDIRFKKLGAAQTPAAVTGNTVVAPLTPETAALPQETTLDLGGGVKMEMVLVKAGEFMMGDDNGNADEKPAHKVKISQPFYVGKYEVTVAQFRRFAETAKFETECERNGNKGTTVKDGKWQDNVEGINWKMPGFKQEENHPVVLVSWNDSQAFVAWASKLSGRGVRLPTEAQWEYAARGTESKKYPWGDKWDGTLANHGDMTLKNAGFTSMNCTIDNDGFAYTSPVGNFKNASWCGAFDMAGNAWEWVNDKRQQDYYAKSPAVDPPGGDGNARIFRGGCWHNDPFVCRAALRYGQDPRLSNSSIGFRVAMLAVSGNTAVAPPKLELFDQPGSTVWLPAGFKYEKLADVNQPMDIDIGPDGRLWIAARDGTVWAYSFATKQKTQIAKVAADTSGERGLHGILCDPGFLNNGFLYLYYTSGAGDKNTIVNRLVRVTVAENGRGKAFLPNSEKILLEVPSLIDYHQGGALKYNPKDKKLYVTIGDNNNPREWQKFFGDPKNQAQDLSDLHGKVLRLNLDGSIPADNPFVGKAGARGETFSVGHRNPYSMNVDAQTGRIFIGEMGYDLKEDYDEINLLRAGGNFGWPLREGPADGKLAGPSKDPSLIDPWLWYTRENGAGVTSGPICRASAGEFAFPARFHDGMFYADYVRKWVRFVSIDPASGKASVPLDFAIGIPAGPLSMLQGPDGALYLVEHPNRISRIVYQPATPPAHVPAAIDAEKKREAK